MTGESTDCQYGLLPLISPGARVLILGSFPSLISLKKNEYYANPRNMFWDIISTLFSIDKDLPYQNRIDLLQEYGMGLWDVFASCTREKSNDAKIRDPVPNNIDYVLKSYPSIQAIFLNGRAAEKGFRNQFSDISLPAYYLPSSSPAHAIPLSKKVDEWRMIVRFLKK